MTLLLSKTSYLSILGNGELGLPNRASISQSSPPKRMERVIFVDFIYCFDNNGFQ